MRDFWNDPPEEYEPPECCGEPMDIDSATGVCSCAKCSRRIEPKLDPSPEPDVSVIDEMMELDPWTFDQTESGWRSLPPDLQIEALRAYVAKNLKGGKLIKAQLPGKALSPGILFWHLGQALALRQSGGNTEAIDWMQCSLDPEDPQWNDYAKATIAFLEDDRVSFDKHSQGDNNNKSTLDRLKERWGRTYSEAYG